MTQKVKNKTLRILVQGRVQGVNYRRWLRGAALERGVHGWVRNRKEGRVEAVLSGDIRAVDDLVHACHQGPMLARVDKLDAEPAEYDGLEDFLIESTME